MSNHKLNYNNNAIYKSIKKYKLFRDKSGRTHEQLIY